MIVRAIVFAFASMFAATTALAQAPGEMTPVPPTGDAASPSGWRGHEPVMANRWAVGLSVGSLGLAPKDQPDNQSKFGIGALSVRFRATLHLELELAVAGGREQVADGTQGDRQVNAGTFGLRYRFAAERSWNWWLAGGVGAISVASQSATDQQRQDAQRPMLQLGIGLERRFRHLAIEVEARAIAVGPDQRDQAEPVMGGPIAQMTTTPPPTLAPPSTAQSGGQLTLGLSYYF